jgi:5-methyltetrahydropteroyltriglutamate--homocysteine methyltransferase
MGFTGDRHDNDDHHFFIPGWYCGNFRGRCLADGDYESVAERLFARTRANHFLLEYDTAGGRFCPAALRAEGKVVVLGLISGKTPGLETMGALQRAS